MQLKESSKHLVWGKKQYHMKVLLSSFDLKGLALNFIHKINSIRLLQIHPRNVPQNTLFTIFTGKKYLFIVAKFTTYEKQKTKFLQNLFYKD